MNTISTKVSLVLMLLASMLSNTIAQNKPFPQAVTYTGCIKPNNVTQASMNSSVSAYYTYWKGKYLKNNLASLPGGYYVKGEITGGADGYTPLGSSEGQGYGMIIAVLMAGQDPDAKTIYDGLFKTARAYKSSANSALMGWVVADAASAQGHFGSATDGDLDIAYSLILAHYQWGSAGAINYLQEAKNMINNGLKASYVTNSNRLNLGDWQSKTTTDSRPSDWMLSHFKAYKDVTADATWDNVSSATYAMISAIQTNYSATTGLMPDFVTGNPVKPAAANFLESENDGNYYYNACRTPLRFVMDYAHNGQTAAKTAANKIVSWAKTTTNNVPANFKAGYTLAGGNVSGNNYSSAVFVAPVVAAATCDAGNQAYLNAGWTSIIGMKEGYFEDTYNLLCQLYISGNWWVPTAGTTPVNVAPTVTLTAPTNGATFTSPATVTISANASDSDGSISKVEFYNGTTLLNSDATAPYSYSWTNVTNGTYTITAKAYDNSTGVTTSTAATITVSTPAVQSPYGGTRQAIPGTVQAENYDLGGQGLAYNDSETANQGNVYRTDGVDIEATTGGGYNVGYIVAGEWLKYMVNVTTAGKYRIVARVATNAASKSFTIEADATTIATVNVPNTGDWQTWQTVTIDNVTLTAGDKTLRFYATTGDFNLDNVVFSLMPNVAPTVSLTAPTAGATFTAPATVTISANAADSDGSISKVEFYQGTTLLNSDATAPYSYSWTGVAAGTYSITAKAYDNSTGVTTSSAVSITVNNPANVAPTVSLTAPTAGATFTAPATVTISANAADSDGSISKVEFYQGTTLLNSDATAPYSYNWTGVAAGTYSIIAKAYDNSTGVTTSSSVSITVNTPVNVAPTVSLTAPTAGATFTAPATVTISANAADSDGSISKVEFYQGTTLLNSDATAPYSYSWTGVAAGTYSITAKAYDNATGQATSAAVSITISPAQTGTEDCSNIAAWNNSAIYVKDNLVTYNGSKYKAKWWTTGEIPANSDQWGVWLKIGECISGTIPPSAKISMTPENTTDLDISNPLSIDVTGLTSGTISEVSYIVYKDTVQVGIITKNAPDFNASWTASQIGEYLLQVIVKNQNGMQIFSDAKDIRVSKTTGVNDATLGNGLVIYPNPTSGLLHVSDNVTSVSIHELSGKQLEQIILKDIKQINLTAYAQGIYLLNLQSESGSCFVKIIKE